MVAQEQHVMLTEHLREPLPLVEVREPLVPLVVDDAVGELQRRLADRHQVQLGLHRERRRPRLVRVKHDRRLRAEAMDRRVDPDPRVRRRA